MMKMKNVLPTLPTVTLVQLIVHFDFNIFACTCVKQTMIFCLNLNSFAWKFWHSLRAIAALKVSTHSWHRARASTRT